MKHMMNAAVGSLLALLATAALAQGAKPAMPSEAELDAVQKRLQAEIQRQEAARQAPVKASGPSLQPLLPNRLSGWVTDPVEPDGFSDVARHARQTFSSKDQESGVDISVTRVAQKGELPSFDQVPLGRGRENSAVVTSRVDVQGRRALQTFELDRDNGGTGHGGSGEIDIVAGLCVVKVRAWGVTQPQLQAIATAVRLNDLERTCVAQGGAR